MDSYDGRNTSGVVRVLRADGSRSQQIGFVGSGIVKQNRRQFVVFLQDKWGVSNRLNIEYGVRYDRDNLAKENNLAPRIAFSFLPTRDQRTVIRGGVGLFYGQIDLNVATFTQLQDRLMTGFAPDGQTIIGGPQRQQMLLDGGRFLTPAA